MDYNYMIGVRFLSDPNPVKPYPGPQLGNIKVFTYAIKKTKNMENVIEGVNFSQYFLITIHTLDKLWFKIDEAY